MVAEVTKIDGAKLPVQVPESMPRKKKDILLMHPWYQKLMMGTEKAGNEGSINLHLNEADLDGQKNGEAKLPGKEEGDGEVNFTEEVEATNLKGEDSFFSDLTGRKNDTSAVRMHVSTLIRDGSLSRKRDIVAENDGLIVTHDYFLRERTPKLSNVLEVDHTLECQFIAHCIMQTEVLRPLLTQVVLTSKAMSGQTEIVKAFLKPIKDIHNCVNTANVGTFNLHLLEKNFNLCKGKATTDFIDRQYSKKGGPINLEHYYKLSNVVKDGLMDADDLAMKMEGLILNVEHQYVQHLSNTQTTLAVNTVHQIRMENLTETIKQVIDKMIEGNKSR